MAAPDASSAPTTTAGHRDAGVVTAGPGRRPAGPSRLFAAIGDRYGKTPGQVILRWHVQLGLVPIPKSGNAERLRQNLEVFDFELTDSDLAEIDRVEAAQRGSGLDPRSHEEF